MQINWTIKEEKYSIEISDLDGDEFDNLRVLLLNLNSSANVLKDIPVESLSLKSVFEK